MNITINEAFYRRHLHHLRPSERGLFLSLIVLLETDPEITQGSVEDLAARLNVTGQFLWTMIQVRTEFFHVLGMNMGASEISFVPQYEVWR